MTDILKRRQTHFVLWCPRETSPPALIIGRLRIGNPARFRQLAHLPLQPVTDRPGLWELEAASCGLPPDQVYHYWFEVDNSWPEPARIQVTDPLAYGVDYRLYAPQNPSVLHPAGVIGWFDDRLIACDAHGERRSARLTAFDKLPHNKQMVIYELPTAWVRTAGSDEFERGVGTFRDVRALVKKKVPGGNFPVVHVDSSGSPYLVALGVNALQLLPPADSIYSREWGYGTSHYLAPDYELGYPEGHLSATANQDLVALIDSCHRRGIRVILDVVLGFMKDEPYRHIDFDTFYLENPEQHPQDPNAYSSRDKPGGGKEFRSSFFASCPRYVASNTSYDPISGLVQEIAPIRRHMLTFLARWMQDFHIDGIRMDSVENVANWDFIQEFKEFGHALFQQRYPEAGQQAREKFIVVGEELAMPLALLEQQRLDGLWNERFQTFARAAVLGENAQRLGEPSFEWTVRKAIDCRQDKPDGRNALQGSQAINYLTSHDVEGARKERLYNLMEAVITLENSSFLFNRQLLEEEVIAEIRREGRLPHEEEVRQRTNGKILHRARLRRIKLAFVCLLTSVGIPMILAGEEFGDQHDLFGAQGQVTHQGGKQVDPVNFSRLYDADRQELFHYVARLVKLRTRHPALALDDTDFIHVDFQENKRVLVWQRGTAADPVVVVANFSDFTTPFAPWPGTEYMVPNWPATPAGHHWQEVTQDRTVDPAVVGKEPIFAWEAKVYRLLPDADA